MNRLRICSLLLLLCAHNSIAQSRPAYSAHTGKPESPERLGYENPISFPTEARSAKLDSKKLKADADTLAQLAQSVPSDIDKTADGVLPKNLPDKLKQIEKLAKRLRGELSAQPTPR